MKHTKGEWKIFWGNYTHFATINKDTQTRICAIEVDNPAETEEQRANAYLIASAPDLLEACEEALKIVGDKTEVFWDAKTAKTLTNAINKAKGE